MSIRKSPVAALVVLATVLALLVLVNPFGRNLAPQPSDEAAVKVKAAL